MENILDYDYISLVEKLSFTRFAGGEGDKKAQDIIIDELEKAGGKPYREEFSFDWYNVKKASLFALEPVEYEIEAKAVAYSGSLNGTVELPFAYAERADGYNLDGKEGYALLVNNNDNDVYTALSNANIPLFITTSGKYYDSPNVPVYGKKLGMKVRDLPSVPGLVIRSADAIKLINSGISKVRASLLQENFTVTTANIVSVVKGKSNPEEIIVFTAHYDSTQNSVGSYDNATGVAAVMALHEYFVKNQPERTMMFVFCGAEENGIKGSRAFAEKHPELLPSIRLEINFDLIGCALGYNGMTYTAGEEVGEYAKQLADLYRHSLSLNCDIAPSDSTVFAAEGIPSCNFYRYGEGEIHNINDITALLSPKSMGITADFVRIFAEAAANSAEFPFERELPDEIFKKAYEYIKNKPLPVNK